MHHPDPVTRAEIRADLTRSGLNLIGQALSIFDADLRRGMAEAAWRAGQRLPRWEDRAAAFVGEIEKAR